MTAEDKKAWACKQLCQKQAELGRLPKKEDFDEVVRSRIKSFLGPWPRALEAAGLKEAKPKALKPKKRNAGKPCRSGALLGLESKPPERGEKEK